MFYRLLLSLFFLCVFSNLVVSQNLENLDQKYGFNKFKLESLFQNYDNRDLKYFATDNEGVVYYDYISKDVNVFGFEIDDLKLGFFKNKLYFLEICVNPINENIYGKVAYELTKLFGNEYEVQELGDFGIRDYRTQLDKQVRWEAKKTLLGLDRVKCSAPILFHPCKTKIWLRSEVLNRQIADDGF